MLDTKVDNVTPGEKWEFDSDVAKCFNNMLERSIPGYTDMRELCYAVSKRFVVPGGAIIDMGASRGEALRPFILENSAGKFYALEVSKPMREEMLAEFGHNSKVSIIDYDLRKFGCASEKKPYFLEEAPCVILSVLTLMFTPIQYRPQIINGVYESLMKGGAFVFVEKVLGTSAKIDRILVDSYYELKSSNGYSPDDIARKKASLEGVQVPLTANFNVDMLKAEGFTNVDCFYRNLNFAGWLAIK